MYKGNRYHSHLQYLERFVKKLDRSKSEEDIRRGSQKKGRIITLASGAVKRVAA